MKAAEVLKILRISRPTLAVYVKSGKIKTTTKPNGQYDYDPESVYAIINKNVQRKTCIYARVDEKAGKAAAQEQISNLTQFCYMNGYTIGSVYLDTASGIGFGRQPELFKMLDEITGNLVERVVILSQDRISRDGFELFKYLCGRHHCEIVIMNGVGSEEADAREIAGDLENMLGCYQLGLNTKKCVQAVMAELE